MLFYPNFFQKFGIRSASQLLSPRLAHLNMLELPMRSLYHYVGESPLEAGPAKDEYLFRHITKPIPMVHVRKLLEFKGLPRPVTLPLDQEIRKYHATHRRYRFLRTMQPGLRDPNVPLVVNYAFLNRLYRYQRTMYAEYNRWWNINATVWKSIAEVAQETDRNQFIEMGLPKLLPGLTDLRIAAEMLDEGDVADQLTEPLRMAMESLVDDQVYFTQGAALEAMNQRTLRIFHTPESLILLELWKWAGPFREKSLISAIPLDKLDRINLIFIESGRWLCINLGVLNRWRNTTEDETAANPDDAITDGIDPLMFQKRVLRMLMGLFQARTKASPEVTAATGVVAPAAEEPVKDTAVPVKTVDAPMEVKVTDAANMAATGATAQKNVVVQIPTNVGADTPELEADEEIDLNPELDAQIERDLAELDRITQAQLKEDERQQGEALAEVQVPTLEESVMKACNRLADDGLLSAAEYRRYQTLAEKYKTIVAPDGKRMLHEYIDIKLHETAIESSPVMKDIPTVLDKTMLKSSLLDFDPRYIKDIMQRDVAAMVMNLQHAAICVTDYQVERVKNITGSYDAYTIKVVPVEGGNSTLRFRLPVVEEDGSYTANGVKYHLRKQRGDLPLRKVAPDTVAMTSYYGKLWVTRSSKKVDNYAVWLQNHVMAKGLDLADLTIQNLRPTNVFDPEFDAPRLYSTLAMSFRSFTCGGFDWSFDHRARETLYGEEALKQEMEGTRSAARIIAQNAAGELLLVDYHNNLQKLVPTVIEGQATYIRSEFPSIEELLQLPLDRAPVDYIQIRVMNREIPVAFVLAYEIGLTALCRLLQVEPRIVPAGTRLNLVEDEYPIIFADETWVFSRDHRFATMILAGMNSYHRQLRDYGSHEFDKRAVYLNLLETEGASARWLREIDLMYQMFIDPITKELLERFHQPLEFRGLLLAASRMLLSDQHPDESDPAFMRAKGYERMAGAVYSALIGTLRGHNGRAGKSRYPLELHPYAVWNAIQTDPSKGLVKDINPIQNLKEKEALTFSGVGGRSSMSMTKSTRKYHVNDMGVTSESTVDSGDVGINTYTSADPQFDSLRGTAKRYVIGETGATALLSTSALVSPGSDHDDPKRVNFVGIQHGHGVACKGYTSAALRTGYESVLAHRTSDLYAYTAKQDGRVVSANEHGVLLEYADGSKKGIAIGRRYGAAEGLTIPHDVVSVLKEGDAFKAGDVVTYNPGFFKKDVLNPKHVIWKPGLLARTVLMESTQTLEDSSSISKHISEALTTRITKVRTVVVSFEQSIRRLVEVGRELGSEDILCIIEDALTANAQLFDEETLDTLKILAAQSPQAKFRGMVEKIEVYYHGDVQDMSASLREIVAKSDTSLRKQYKSIGETAYTGSVKDGFRVDGDPLALDTAAIRIYLSADVPAGVGDKGVFANQMKTVFGQVLENEWRTESGLTIDAVFGAKSIADRIVSSPYLIGTTTTLLDVIGKRAVQLYRNS